MTILGFLVRFFALYVVAAIIVIYLFRDISGYWVQSGLLIAVIYSLSRAFVRKNRRFFTPRERLALVFGVISMDILSQAIRIFLHFFHMADQAGGAYEASAFQTFFGLILLIVIHLVAVLYLLKLAKLYAAEISALQ